MMFLTDSQMAVVAERLRHIADGKTSLHESPWQHQKVERTDKDQMAIYDARVKELVITQKKTQKETAILLGISESKVHRHMERIRQKP